MEEQNNFEVLRKEYKEKLKQLENKELYSKFLNSKEESLNTKLNKIDEILKVQDELKNLEFKGLQSKVENILKNAKNIDQIKKTVAKVKDSDQKLTQLNNKVTQGKILIKQLNSKDQLTAQDIKKIEQLKETISSFKSDDALLFNFDKKEAENVIKKKVKDFKDQNQEVINVLNKKKKLFKEQEQIEEDKKRIQSIRDKMLRDGKQNTITKEKALEQKLKDLLKKQSEVEKSLDETNKDIIEKSTDINKFKESAPIIKVIENKNIDDDNINSEIGALKKTGIGKFVVQKVEEIKKEEKENKYSKEKLINIAEKVSKGTKLSATESKIYNRNKTIVDNLSKKQKKITVEKKEDNKFAANIKTKVEAVSLDKQDDYDIITENVEKSLDDSKKKIKTKNQKLDQEFNEKIENITKKAIDNNNQSLDESPKLTEVIKEKSKKIQASTDKNLGKQKNTIDEGLEKLEILSIEKEVAENLAERDKLLEEKKKKKSIQQQVLDKKILMASSNIGTEINSLGIKIRDEERKAEPNNEVLSKLITKRNSYVDLRDRLVDNNTTDIEKEGLISLLGNGEWLQDYISHRSENIGIDKEYVDKKLSQAERMSYSKLGDTYYTDLYKHSIEEQKYGLIEEFATLKNGIPGLEHLGINDNLGKAAQRLGITDNKTLAKVRKLVDLQETITNFSVDSYTDSFLSKVENKRKGIEFEMRTIENDKNQQLLEIDKLNISDVGKERMKDNLLENYDKKMQELSQASDSISQEIDSINSIQQKEGGFSKEDIKNLSGNLKLFSIVANHDGYGDIISGLSEDIIGGNTEFINFNSANLQTGGDIYTTDKIKQIAYSQIEVLENLISLSKKDPNLDQKEYLKLIKDKAYLDKIINQIERGDLQEEEVKKILSFKTLQKFAHNEDKLEYLQDMNDENLTDEEKLQKTKDFEQKVLNYDQFKKDNAKKIKELKVAIKKAKTEEERERLVTELEDAQGAEQRVNEKLISNFDIDEDTIREELSDGYKVLSDADYLSDSIMKGKEKIKDLKRKGKVIAASYIDGEDVLNESRDKITARNKSLERYVFTPIFEGGFSGIVKFFFLGLDFIVDRVANAGRDIDIARQKIEDNRVTIFGITLGAIIIITIFAEKSTFTFLDVNTRLFSIGDYQTTKDGIIDFATTEGDEDIGKMGLFYYKMNIALFFTYIIVIYQVIIEFLYRYLLLLKDPSKSGDIFIRRAAKFLLIIIMLSLIFKVETLFAL